MGTFHHFGVPTNVKQENESYMEGAKLFLTDPEAHRFRIEFLRFEDGSPMHPDIINNPHAAFMVENLEAELEGKNIIMEPTEISDTLKIAFFNEDGAVIELMQTM
ncbi:MAG: hypothetical protein KAS23_08995 [Anaerohalosphaera sp.]|nr:hypothetical protein [Anaerohalosphaera sp.]